MANISQEPVEWKPETLKRLGELLGSPLCVSDRFNALFDQVEDITSVRQLARETQTPTSVSLHEPGDIITLDDGRRYEVDDAGRWIRMGDR